MRAPELLLPAGSLPKAQFALDYGADAVYVGAAGLSMRPDQASLTIPELAKALALTQARGKRLYVAINTLLFEQDTGQLQAWLQQTRELAFDAVIVSDPGALHWVRQYRPELAVHISTQLSTANSAAAAFWGAAGASRVILARECSIADAAHIAARSGVEVEVFVHGAMCVAVSGRCLLSAHLSGRSASRGDCKQSCRWEWQLVEQKRPGETIPVFENGRQTILLGSTDLCLISRIPELMRSGATSFKVEGRMKSKHYVAGVARVYRAAIDRYLGDPDGYAPDPEWISELEAVSHRPYSEGFASGFPAEHPESLQTFNRPVSTHDAVAYVCEATSNECLLDVKHPLHVGDRLTWIGPRMRAGRLTIAHLCNEEGEPQQRAVAGTKTWARFDDGQRLGAACILRRQRADDAQPPR